MINFDAVDFSERRPEEVISFFWRSVYKQSPVTFFSEEHTHYIGKFVHIALN